jgi:hypothetical protein
MTSKMDPVNWEKVDEIVLALIHLTTFEERDGIRTWKGYDWDVLNRLHKRGLIGDPVSKGKSVALTDEGRRLSQELFEKHFLRAV